MYRYIYLEGTFLEPSFLSIHISIDQLTTETIIYLIQPFYLFYPLDGVHTSRVQGYDCNNNQLAIHTF